MSSTMHMIKSITLWGAKYAIMSNCVSLFCIIVCVDIWHLQHQKTAHGPQATAIAPATISYSFKEVPAFLFTMHSPACQLPHLPATHRGSTWGSTPLCCWQVGETTPQCHGQVGECIVKRKACTYHLEAIGNCTTICVLGPMSWFWLICWRCPISTRTIIQKRPTQFTG